MERKGIPSLMALWRRLALSKSDYTKLIELAAMKISARDDKDDWIPLVYEIAMFLECQPEELFSEQQQYSKLKKNTAVGTVSYGEVQQYLAGRTHEQSTPEQIAQANELSKLLTSALSTLTPREERIIRMRFGFAKEFGTMTPTRVAQIEAKALLKLKHPYRATMLREAGTIRDGKNITVLDTGVMDALKR
jgi:DNA-directed RNA polymerase specialized sigma subunit